MAEPVGLDSYKGLGVPKEGDAEIRQLNSSNTIWTLTHSTANTGSFIVGRNSVSSLFWGQGSSVQTGDQFRITASGAYQVTSNSTVVASISSAGLIGGGQSTLRVWGIDSTGRFTGYKKLVTALTSAQATTIYTLATSESGSIITYSATSGGMTIALPTTIAAAGLEYTIVQDAGTAAVMQITSSGSNMDIVLAGGAQNSTGPSTADALAPGSTAAQGCRIFSISTARWFLEPFVSLRVAVTSAAMEGAGTWVAGTTIA